MVKMKRDATVRRCPVLTFCISSTRIYTAKGGWYYELITPVTWCCQTALRHRSRPSQIARQRILVAGAIEASLLNSEAVRDFVFGQRSVARWGTIAVQHVRAHGTVASDRAHDRADKELPVGRFERVKESPVSRLATSAVCGVCEPRLVVQHDRDSSVSRLDRHSCGGSSQAASFSRPLSTPRRCQAHIVAA
jgi:hypothetical protein